MSELSIFIESSDFGAYEPHAPYYFITLVFYDQSNNISERIDYKFGRLSRKFVR